MQQQPVCKQKHIQHMTGICTPSYILKIHKSFTTSDVGYRYDIHLDLSLSKQYIIQWCELEKQKAHLYI